MTMEQIAVELLGLPARDRALLAEKLIASLEQELGADVDAAWADEASRRLAEVERGEVSTRPAHEVLADARARLER